MNELTPGKSSGLETQRLLVPLARAVDTVLGSILIIAAVLKIYGHTDLAPQLREGWLRSVPLTFALAICEVALGALLLSGLWMAKKRRVAILVFAVFAMVGFAEGIGGQRSCGCFGAVQISPWYTAMFDLYAVAGSTLAFASSNCDGPNQLTIAAHGKLFSAVNCGSWVK